MTPTPARRLAALAALACGLLTVLWAATLVLEEAPRAPFLAASVVVALAAGAYGIVRRGVARVLALGVGAILLVNVLAGLVEREGPLPALVVGSALVTSAAAAAAFRVRVQWPPGPRPRRPVLFWNPRSGDGKAERLGVAAAARERGIEPVELRPGQDLEALARDAVARGADALAMAGGDGSQAVVAAVAAEHDVPFACIPAGTRNHFALDLGVDRDDVIGALDAFVDGGERIVDLAEVGGRVFVNNVSIGVYAEAVQLEHYRGAKLRTLFATVPEVVGPGAAERDVRWRGPDEVEHNGSVAVLVANNRYRLGRGVGAGTRPCLHDGTLGITVIGPTNGESTRLRLWRRPVLEWTAPALEIESGRPVAVGIDGEAALLQPPVRFRTRPLALRVRIARSHPGASPSAFEPRGAWDGIRTLAAIVAGREAAVHRLHAGIHDSQA
jgi:diacylglycerol kinase family enzyme